MWPAMQFIDQAPRDPITLDCYPPAQYSPFAWDCLFLLHLSPVMRLANPGALGRWYMFLQRREQLPDVLW